MHVVSSPKFDASHKILINKTVEFSNDALLRSLSKAKKDKCTKALNKQTRKFQNYVIKVQGGP